MRSLERVPVAGVRRAAQFQLEFVRVADRDRVVADARHDVAVAVDLRSDAAADERCGNVGFQQLARAPGSRAAFPRPASIAICASARLRWLG